MVKYLYVDADMIGSYTTIDDIYDNVPTAVIYQSTEYASVYKQGDKYFFYANTPWKNGLMKIAYFSFCAI